MKIAIYCSNVVPIHARTLDERAVGGTETGVIRLAEALDQMGHDVTVYTPHENPPTSQPRYLSKEQITQSPEFDAFIAVRDWIPLLFQEVKAKRKYFWTGDAADQYPNFGIGDRRVASQIHALLTVSDWQAKTLSEASGFPHEKTFVLGNGIDLSLFEGEELRNSKRLIYSSMPYRGLVYVPTLFQALRKKYPDLELHVFSGYDLYDQPDKHMVEIRNALTALPGCTLHGTVKQKQLAREFMKSAILFYPCHFEETSCITAMEAQAGGCAIVSSHLAALPETVGESGILVREEPGSPAFLEAIFRATDQILSDPQLWKKFSDAAIARAKNFSWRVVAKRLETFLMVP
jgi:glycosyltransferase involved in cell wall biosynthesis